MICKWSVSGSVDLQDRSQKRSQHVAQASVFTEQTIQLCRPVLVRVQFDQSSSKKKQLITQLLSNTGVTCVFSEIK